MTDRDDVAQDCLDAAVADIASGIEDVVSTYGPGQVPADLRVLVEGFEKALADYRAENALARRDAPELGAC